MFKLTPELLLYYVFTARPQEVNFFSCGFSAGEDTTFGALSTVTVILHRNRQDPVFTKHQVEIHVQNLICCSYWKMFVSRG